LIKKIRFLYTLDESIHYRYCPQAKAVFIAKQVASQHRCRTLNYQQHKILHNLQKVISKIHFREPIVEDT
jgi:hypothetical protein